MLWEGEGLYKSIQAGPEERETVVMTNRASSRGLRENRLPWPQFPCLGSKTTGAPGKRSARAEWRALSQELNRPGALCLQEGKPRLREDTDPPKIRTQPEAWPLSPDSARKPRQASAVFHTPGNSAPCQALF